MNYEYFSRQQNYVHHLCEISRKSKIILYEFVLSSSLTLGIMPEDGIVRVLEGKIPHPKDANGIPRCEIYVYVDDPDKYYDKLKEFGGVGISRGALRSWGDYASYGFDPDGHILAFATKKLD